MPWEHIRVARFGGPEVLELAEEQTVPAPGPGEARIKVLAAGTGFTDAFVRRGRYGSQAMAVGREGLLAAGLGIARLKVWNGLGFLFGGRRAVWYSITDRRVTHPEEFKADMAALFDLLREGAIHPVVVDRLPIAAAREVHDRIDAGGLRGKIVLLPWPKPE